MNVLDINKLLEAFLGYLTNIKQPKLQVIKLVTSNSYMQKYSK